MIFQLVCTSLLLSLAVAIVPNNFSDHALYQTYYYKQSQEQANIPQGVWTSASGAPISIRDATSSLNRKILHHQLLVNELTHLASEKIPERTVHAKGAGAFGYFQVTNDISHICKAKFLEEVGKITPIGVRFSLTNERADTARDIRGFAVKFYTEEGNFDIAGFNVPVFFFKDPLLFINMQHVLSRRNPASNVPDLNAFWDIVSENPQFFNVLLRFFSDSGTPDGFRYLPGFSIHSYQVVNHQNQTAFLRFHFIPERIQTLTQAQAAQISDLEYATRDLYNAIALGNYPNWDVAVQIFTLEDVQKNPRLIDITRYLPLDQFPLHKIGKMVLNRNPQNYFAEIEQIHFCPSHVVPGILGAPDKVFEFRALSYTLGASYRLGVNHQKIPVNCPMRTVANYLRDGVSPTLDNGGGAPVYYPNNYYGPQPVADIQPDIIDIHEGPQDNYDQIREYYTSLPQDQKLAIYQNAASALALGVEPVQDKIINILKGINLELGSGVEAAMHQLAAAAAAAASGAAAPAAAAPPAAAKPAAPATPAAAPAPAAAATPAPAAPARKRSKGLLRNIIDLL